MDENSLWDTPFKLLSRVGWKRDHSRGIYRSTQQYDPFVYESLKHFDRSLLEKAKGFTRVAGPDVTVLDRLRAYDRPSHKIPEKYLPAYNQALNKLRAECKLDQKVVPKWIYDVDIIPNTSSGYPYYKKKADIKDQLFSDARYLFHLMKRKDYLSMGFPYATPAVRGASRPSEEEKTRLVWMYPASMLICEGVFAQPLINKYYNAFKTNELFLTGKNGKFKHRQIICQVEGDGLDQETHVVGFDFTSFDTLPCRRMIEDVFEVLNENIAHGYYWDKTGSIQGGTRGVEARSRKAFENIKNYFIETPIILPNGRIVRKHIGVPSGSHFTNLIDSLVNRLMHLTMAIYYGWNICNLRTNGDDSLFSIKLNQKESAFMMKSRLFFEDAFGMIMNIDKSCIAEIASQVHASGTRWNALDPWRDTVDWFRLALNSKSYTRDPIEGFQRLLGIGVCGGFRDGTYCRYFEYYQRGYNCRDDRQRLDWTKYRWIEMVFGEVDLPVYYKAASTAKKLLLQSVT